MLHKISQIYTTEMRCTYKVCSLRNDSWRGHDIVAKKAEHTEDGAKTTS
jgi:hypothetical protein